MELSRLPAPRWTAALFGVLGIILIGLAVPRLVSGIALAPYGETVARLGIPLVQAPMPPRSELYAAAESRRQALSALRSAHAYAELGALYLAEARIAGFGTRNGGALLDQTTGALRASLSLSPLQPYAWTQLALAMYLREPGNPALNRIMRLAIETAPYEPRLVERRADLGLAMWDRLDEGTREMVAGQIRLAAAHAPDALADAAKRYARLATVRTMLEGNPALMRNFLSAYLRRT